MGLRMRATGSGVVDEYWLAFDGCCNKSSKMGMENMRVLPTPAKAKTRRPCTKESRRGEFEMFLLCR